MKRVAFAGAVLAAAASMSAYAQDDGGGAAAADSGPDLETATGALGNRIYIAPMASHVWEDSERQTDDGWGGTLAIGKQFSPTFMAEISAFYQEHHVASDVDALEMMGVGLSALIFPLNNKGGLARNIYGIVGAHYGEGKEHPSSASADLQENYTTVFGSAGLGFLFGPINWLNGGAFRVEALYRMDFHD